MDATSEHILYLENYLLKSEVRKSPQKISRVLEDDFIEFTSSGYEYHYKKGDVFQKEDDNSILSWEIIEFEIKRLSDKCVLATYKLVKNNKLDKEYSLRSSIWKYSNGKWKMSFHQGTITNYKL